MTSNVMDTFHAKFHVSRLDALFSIFFAPIYCTTVLDRMRKDITSIFKNDGLSITIETNLIEIDFLDVTFNLSAGKYFPFRNHFRNW